MYALYIESNAVPRRQTEVFGSWRRTLGQIVVKLIDEANDYLKAGYKVELRPSELFYPSFNISEEGKAAHSKPFILGVTEILKESSARRKK